MTITVAADCTSATLASTVIDALGPLGVKSSGTLTASDITDGETVTIDAKTYTFQDTLANVDGNVFITGDVTAFSLLVFSGNPTNGDTVTIDAKTYTFQTVLTNVDGNVAIGIDAATSRDNLVAAITLGAGSGTAYAAATTVHPTCTASANASDALIEFKIAGKVGNGTICSETSAQLNFPSGNLNSGTTDVATTLTNLGAAIDLGAGSGTAYAAATTAHPTVEVGVYTPTTITVRAQATGTAGDSIATTETGGSMSWANATLTGGVDEGTYTALDIVVTDQDGSTDTISIVEADKTGSDYVVTPTDLGDTTTITDGFYKFTVTSTAPVTTGTDENCALIDCGLECEVYDAVLANLKRPSAVRTEYHLIYQSLLNVTDCQSCDCDVHLDMYAILKRDINNPTLLDQDDCGCS